MSTGDMGGIKAGGAFLEFSMRDEKFRKQIDGVQRKLRKFGRQLTSISKDMAMLGTAATAAFAAIGKAASNAELSVRKFGLQFGDQASQLEKALSRISKSTDVPMGTLIEQMASTGGLFSELKGQQGYVDVLTRVQNATLSLAVLTGSFAEAQERMLSGLTGSTEVLEKFGVETKVSALNQKAMEMGLGRTVEQMTEMEKKLLRLIVIEDAFNRQGIEFNKLSDTMALQLDIAWQKIRQLTAALGKGVSEAWLPFVKYLNESAEGLTNMAKKFSPVLGKISIAVAGFTGLAFAIHGVGLAALFASGAMTKLAALSLSPTVLAIAAGLLAFAAAVEVFTEGGVSGMMSEFKDFATARYGSTDQMKLSPLQSRGLNPKDFKRPATISGAVQRMEGEARGTFSGAMVEQQMAFGTSATAMERVAEAIDRIETRLIQPGPRGDAVRTAPITE